MAASTRKAEVHIALNGTQAQNGLKDLDRLALILSQDLERMAKELKDIEITLGTSSKEYKALSREMSGVETRMKAYTAAVDVEVEKTKKLGDVVADLANTKLRDLKRAVGSGRTSLQGLTGSDKDLKKAEEIRKQMKQVMDMQRLIEGEYVKIAEGLSTVGTKSDQWLSKAIKQQKDLVASLDKTDAEYKKQAGILRQLTAEEERRKSAAKTMVNVSDVIARGKQGKASIDELNMAYRQLSAELNKLNTGTKEFAAKQKDLKGLKKQIDKVTGAANKQSSAWSTAMKNLVAYVGLFGAFNMLKQKLTDAIQLNMKFSDQIANIRKVSGLAVKDVEQLTKELAKIDTRTSIQELNNIAYAGAKLGMGQYGVKGLEQFVQAANQVNVALKEDLGEEALTALSKITEVMGLIPKMGVEKSMLATGSAMFKLASTSTATSENIVEFTKRLTGIARTAGMTTDQLLALGSAADSMMLMPEVASTAFNKLITSLQRGPGAIENSLGIEQGTIDKLFSAGKTMDAIVLILEKMKAKGNMNALDDVFKDLGSDGARLIQVMVTMSKNVNMLKSHLYTATEAFKEATAVTDEYNIQQDTAQALMERSANAWEKMFVNANQTTKDSWTNIDALARRWYELTQVLTNSSSVLTSIRILMGGISLAVQTLIYLLPSLMGLLTTGGVIYSIQNAGKMFAFLRAEIDKARIAYAALNMASKATLWLGVISAIGTLVYTIARMRQEADKAAVSFEKLNQYRKDAIANAAEETRKLNEYKTVLSSANMAQEERQRLIQKFNNQYATYLEKLGLEVNSVEDLRSAYSRLNDEIRKKTIAEMRDQAMADTTKPLAEESHERYNELRDVLTKHKYGAIDARYVKSLVDQNQSADAIFGKVVEAKYGVGVTAGKGGNVSYKNEQGKTVSGNLSDVYGAILNYVNAEGRYKQGIDTVNDKFSDLLGDWNNEEAVVLGHLNNKTKLDANTVNRAADDVRNNLQEFYTRIKDFYERQITAEIERMTAEGIEKPVQDRVVEDIKRQLDNALIAAETSVVEGKKTWQEFSQFLDKDRKEKDDQYGQSKSRMLQEQILATDVEKLRHALLLEKARVKKGKITGYYSDESDMAYLARTSLDASKRERSNATIDQKVMERRRKELLEHDYTGVVQQKSFEGLMNAGVVSPDTSSEEAFKASKQQIISMLEKARTDIVAVMETGGDKKSLLSSLGIDKNSDTFKPLLVNDIEGHLDTQLFYQKLIQYFDEYTEAEKKAADERKKVNAFLWNHDEGKMFSDEVIKTSEGQKKEDARQRSFGAKGNPDTPWGQVTENDPEIALFMLKLEQAQAYYNFLKEHSADEAQLAEQSKAITDAQSSLMDAIVAKAAKTAEAQRKWYKPIEQYGTALGEALTDESKSVKDATKSMINSFIDLTGEYVNQKLTQWIMTKLYNSLMASSEQELATTKQTVAKTNATTAVTEAGVEVEAGTAAGAARTIGQLGWWGIPLVAAITAVLGGLMALAKGALSNAFGSNSAAAKTNTKLVSGMLTYDEGNVQQYRGTDGQVYSAQQVGALTTGIVTSPIATTVNGQPSLVGERGPEIVVGRETTAAIMRNDPGLLSALVNYDRNYSGRRYRTYDEGNVQSAVQTQQEGSNVAQDNTQLMQLMSSVLHYLQNPVAPNINMYGRGGLHEKMQKADSFMKNR